MSDRQDDYKTFRLRNSFLPVMVYNVNEPNDQAGTIPYSHHNKFANSYNRSIDKLFGFERDLQNNVFN
jgi:hypothetical protein